MSNKNTRDLDLDEPIEVGEYTYKVNVDCSGMTIKAKHLYNSSTYLCFVSSDSIQKYNEYRSIDSIKTLYMIMINLLIARSPQNHNYGLSLLCGNVKDFSIEYYDNSIIMKILIKGWGQEEEDTITLSLKKTYMEEDIRSDNSSEDYEEKSEENDCDCSQHLAKITELENIIISMKKEIDNLKSLKKN